MIASISSIEGTTTSGVLNTKKLSITNEGISHIANILQDTLYTDKILAPIREYSTNAMDAHREAGKPLLPILVKLPNRFSPVFAVRDFGIGMDDDRIWNVFCNYGSSTKRGSNEQVGMLGIGSKSAFAYPECKSFTVVSIRNGVKKSFVCHKGGCAEGELVQLAEEVTTEADGLEIQIPISVADIQSFIDRSAKFFAHWEVTPTFEGATLDITKAERLFEGEGWYMAKEDSRGYSNKGAKLLMGDIAYSVGNMVTMKATENGISDNEEYAYRKLLEANLVLKAPIGSVDIAANREALQMTDKTIKTLWEILKKVRVEIGAELQKNFDVLPTLWDKRCLRQKFSAYSSPLAQYSMFLPRALHDLGTSIRISDDCGFKTLTFSRARRGKRRVRCTAYAPWSIEASENTAVIINTDPTLADSAIRNRVLALIERQDNFFKKSFGTVHVLNIADVTKFNLWKVSAGFDFQHVDLISLPVYKFSDIYPNTRKPSTRSINADKNSKKFLILDMACKDGEDSDFFKAGTVPKKPVNRIPYIVIDRYQVVTPSGEVAPSNVISHLNNLVKEFKVKLPDAIVAVKKGSAERLETNPHYIPLWEALAVQLKSNGEFIDRMVTLELRAEFGCMTNSGNRYITVCDGLQIDNRIFTTFKGDESQFDPTKLFHSILVKYNEIEKLVVLPKTAIVLDKGCVVASIIKGQKTFESKVAGRVKTLAQDFRSGLESFYKTYPMVKLIDSYNFGYSSKPTVVKEIGDYVKLVDSSTK
jgi:hypothetical protein